MSVKEQFMQATADHQATWYTAQRVKLPDDVSAWLDDKEGQCAKLWNKLPPEVETEYREGMSRNISKARELLSGQNIDDLKYHVYLVYTNLKRMQSNVSIYRDVKKTDGADTGRKKSKEKKDKNLQQRLERVKELYIEADGRSELSKAAHIAGKMNLTPATIRNLLDKSGLKKKKTKKS